MKLEGQPKRTGRRGKSLDLMGRAQSSEPFRVEEILYPEDLRILKPFFQELTLRGRRYNASELVSALTLAYGHRPGGFISEEVLSAFYEYLAQETSFGRKNVLINVLIAYPEERERYAPFIESVWDKAVLSEEQPPYSVGPEDMVLLRILKPELQHQIKLAPEIMAKKEEEILKKISDRSHLWLLAEEIVPLLLADPSFKVRIPNVTGLILDMKQEVARLRVQHTDETWKQAAFLMKGIVVLSADEVGINDKGEIVLTHHGQLPAQPSMPERSIL